MHDEALSQSTRELLTVFTKHRKLLEGFYLTGGTALTLHLGHRESDDLDFFSQRPFNSQRLLQHLEPMGRSDNVELDKGTLNAYINKVKVQFLHYPYKLLEKPRDWKGITISSLIDIACTKCVTISTRGSKKDFIDMYALLQHYSLKEILRKVKQKYQEIDYSEPAILKSLVYFEEAQLQPMPRLHINVEWEEVKINISQKVKSFRI